MFIAVIFLTLLIRIPHGITIFRSCVPNTQFLLNGRLCHCNSNGQANESSCQAIGRRQACQPGQVIWDKCSQCICQENGKLLCTNTQCTENALKLHGALRSDSLTWCSPFKSYYVNCTLCVCPASGKMKEARCATDSSCSLKGSYTSLETIPQNICIPKVMYLFNCLHCMCLDDGRFHKSKCVETCQKSPESLKRCKPKTFYKTDCNICRCPDNGLLDNSVCSKSTCSLNTELKSLHSLRNKTFTCVPNKYTKPRCIYCECNTQSTVNEQACLEQECLKVDDFNYDSVKRTCSPGEMVSTCVECFCPRTKLTIEKYCTKVCSSQNRLSVLETVLKEKVNVIDRSTVKETTGTDSCDPNSLFLDQGRYCLCSDNGNTNFKQCTSVLEDTVPKKPSKVFEEKYIQGSGSINFNISCEPNTYVEFGCNSCYCMKNGKIDPKWCTRDNCESKKLISESNAKFRFPKISKDSNITSTCVSGSITKKDCNFCICGNSGLIIDRVCTNNTCDGLQQHVPDINCDPSSYFTVDCNMCYCPSDGVKNVEKCTKNQCESNFLRTDSCIPGQLFSSDCNICVCPPSGVKIQKICTNRTCFEDDAPWRKIFKISQNLLEKQVHPSAERTKNFEPCFPGEEFEMGCKVCICPEMGLKEYATCTPVFCDTQITDELGRFMEDRLYGRNETFNLTETRRRRKTHKHKKLPDTTSEMSSEEDIYDEIKQCTTYNVSMDSERKKCTPGSEYIVRCKICICPYMGGVHLFCRTMPKNRYCEQPYPGFNYLAMGRRILESDNSTANSTTSPVSITVHAPHNHTKYSCNVNGRIVEDCFICDCVKNVIIEEHCYKSNAENCTDVQTPKCIKMENKLYT